MKLQDVLNSRLAISLGLAISSFIPPWLGYPLARQLAECVAARRKSLMVQAVRANQWMIHPQHPGSSELDQLTRHVFRSAGRSLYEFYHFFRKPEVVKRMVQFDPSFQTLFEKARNSRQGTLMVAPHISNFDMIGRTIALQGLPIQILSYPQPPSGYQRQNELRQLPNLRVTPMSIQSLQEASKTLRAGGTVITGVDRPLPDPDAKYRPRFFGKPAAMPVFHIRLALKHNIPIYVLGAERQHNGAYRLYASQPIVMRKHSELIEETVSNAEAVLKVIEEVICCAPEQWAMFYPVWPETLERVST